MAIVVRDRRPRPEVARSLVAGYGNDVDLAVLSGGIVRGIDVGVVRMIDDGLVRADPGRLGLTPAGEARLAEASYRDDGLRLLEAVRDVGERGLAAVRDRAPVAGLRRALDRAAVDRLIVSPRRRKWEAMTVAAPMGAGVLVFLIGMLSTARTYREFQELESSPGLGLAIFLGLMAMIPAAVIYVRKHGYTGPDPTTTLGREVLRQLGDGLPARAGEAPRVALGGLAAISDDGLRRNLASGITDSRWNIRPKRDDVTDVNASFAVYAMDAGGDGGADGDG
ncbi:hypothetical protein [Micromonospora sp. KC721]|uniref:hypothetical protein n=1 Tax=Micromonospora sp. KC721 TaxID=2530380 RepID=UPI00140469A7|nr:hypothetical protein [Micromonospora sp. KC721]